MQCLHQSPENPYTAPGRWYRGNLHTHTTQSDGPCTPLEEVARYAELGYDFLALTDHDRLTEVEGLDGLGLLVLPGIETHPGCNQVGEPYHLVAVGVSQAHSFGREHPVQEAIDELRADGAVVWLGHPYWLGLTWAEMIGLQGVIGLEVFNATCTRFGKGFSTVHWDDLLARRQLPCALAVDDVHVPEDRARGWVMVKAPELTQQSLLQSLLAGCFYASQGPEILDVQVTPAEVYVRCSPAQAITCVSLAGRGDQVIAAGPERPLTEASFRRRQQRSYVRLECTDVAGHTAWSPPFPL